MFDSLVDEKVMCVEPMFEDFPEIHNNFGRSKYGFSHTIYVIPQKALSDSNYKTQTDFQLL